MLKVLRKEVVEEPEVVVIEPEVVKKQEPGKKAVVEEKVFVPAFEPEIDDSPAPTVKVSGVSPQGEIKMTFDQDMYVPPNIDSTDFSSILEVAIKSRLDGSMAFGKFITYQDWMIMKAEEMEKKNSTNSTRLLKRNQDDLALEEQVEGCADLDDCDATNKVFEWTVEKFDKKEIVIQTNFDKPGQISTNSYGADYLEVSIQKPTFFIAKRKRGRKTYYMEPKPLNIE